MFHQIKNIDKDKKKNLKETKSQLKTKSETTILLESFNTRFEQAEEKKLVNRNTSQLNPRKKDNEEKGTESKGFLVYH